MPSLRRPQEGFSWALLGPPEEYCFSQDVLERPWAGLVALISPSNA